MSHLPMKVKSLGLNPDNGQFSGTFSFINKGCGPRLPKLLRKQKTIAKKAPLMQLLITLGILLTHSAATVYWEV